jgi:hypothetical protein
LADPPPDLERRRILLDQVTTSLFRSLRHKGRDWLSFDHIATQAGQLFFQALRPRRGLPN